MNGKEGRRPEGKKPGVLGWEWRAGQILCFSADLVRLCVHGLFATVGGLQAND